MKRHFFHSVQGKIISILIVFMSITFATSIYAINYVSQTVMNEGKKDKLLGIAKFLEEQLGEQSYDDILAENGASNKTNEEKIAVLNAILNERTENIASIYPRLGVGYYSLDLDAIITYGPKKEYGANVGLAISEDHPGRTVMGLNESSVIKGSMVRGNIMNAMHPIERDGRVIGYAWANELTTEIENEYANIVGRTIAFPFIFFLVTVGIAVYLSQRMTSDIDRLIAGVKEIRYDLTKRIGNVGGELGDIAESINNMAEHIEKTSKEHEALILAKAANQAQRDFLSRMSHELRTPMNGVLGMTQLAMQAEKKEDVFGYLKKIQSSATLLLGIINDILDFSKIEAGKLEIDKQPFIIREAVGNVCELIQSRAKEKNLQLKTYIAKNVPKMALGDSLKLSQVLLNLLGNAVKFTKQGSVSLNINLVPEADKIKLECKISDTGIGLTKEQLINLFEPFAQADSSTVRKFGGTGLGLSISKAMVELMGGEISVTSTPEVGSTFSFYVILEKCDKIELDRSNNKNDTIEPLYKGYKALLAEDNAINQEIALAILTEFGLDVTVVDNGKSAVESFENGEYDIIFMDIQMPVMNGFEATIKIRGIEQKCGSAKRIPVVAMTANAMREDRVASKEAGMDGHIAKPLDLSEIKEVLHNVFSS